MTLDETASEVFGRLHAQYQDATPETQKVMVEAAGVLHLRNHRLCLMAQDAATSGNPGVFYAAAMTAAESMEAFLKESRA